MNVLKTIATYRNKWGDQNTQVHFMDNAECRQNIEQAEPKLVQFFDSENDKENSGAFRADICRVATLYLHGGYYFDTDLEVVHVVELGPNVQFSTVTAQVEKVMLADGTWRVGEFFQAFLACSAQNPILRETIRAMIEYYQGTRTLHGLMGTSTLRDGFDAIPAHKRGEVYLMEEFSDGPKLYPDLSASIMRRESRGCCCNWIVHDPAIQRAYFYSRIMGVKLCRAIPRHFWFTYRENMLETKVPHDHYENMQNTIAR